MPASEPVINFKNLLQGLLQQIERGEYPKPEWKVWSLRASRHPWEVVFLCLKLLDSEAGLSHLEVEVLRAYRKEVFPGPLKKKGLSSWAAYLLASEFLSRVG